MYRILFVFRFTRLCHLFLVNSICNEFNGLNIFGFSLLQKNFCWNDFSKSINIQNFEHKRIKKHRSHNKTRSRKKINSKLHVNITNKIKNNNKNKRHGSLVT